MFQYYFLTTLEQWVERMYTHIGITSPSQLNIKELAAKLDIWIYFREFKSMSIEHNGFYSVSVDSRLSPEQQWEDFLHELCHLLRHCGNQQMLPEEFVDLQEEQASHFQLYAAVPFSMLKNQVLPQTKKQCVDMLIQEFQVSEELAFNRTEQIYRRIESGREQQVRSQYSKKTDKKFFYSPPKLVNWKVGDQSQGYEED